MTNIQKEGKRERERERERECKKLPKYSFTKKVQSFFEWTSLRWVQLGIEITKK